MFPPTVADELALLLVASEIAPFVKAECSFFQERCWPTDGNMAELATTAGALNKEAGSTVFCCITSMPLIVVVVVDCRSIARGCGWMWFLVSKGAVW